MLRETFAIDIAPDKDGVKTTASWANELNVAATGPDVDTSNADRFFCHATRIVH